MMEVVRRGIPLDCGTELHIERFSPLPVEDGTPFELGPARPPNKVVQGFAGRPNESVALCGHNSKCVT